MLSVVFSQQKTLHLHRIGHDVGVWRRLRCRALPRAPKQHRAGPGGGGSRTAADGGAGVGVGVGVELSIYLSIYLSIHPSIYLSIYPSIHPSIYVETDDGRSKKCGFEFFPKASSMLGFLFSLETALRVSMVEGRLWTGG